IVAFALAACAQQSSPPKLGAPQRIVSLMPSFTEDLCAIGAAKQLVGVSQFSADIPCARGLPQVDSAASVNAEKIVALHPDRVFGIPSQRLAVAPLQRVRIPVFLLPN